MWCFSHWAAQLNHCRRPELLRNVCHAEGRDRQWSAVRRFLRYVRHVFGQASKETLDRVTGVAHVVRTLVVNVHGNAFSTPIFVRHASPVLCDPPILRFQVSVRLARNIVLPVHSCNEPVTARYFLPPSRKRRTPSISSQHRRLPLTFPRRPISEICLCWKLESFPPPPKPCLATEKAGSCPPTC